MITSVCLSVCLSVCQVVTPTLQNPNSSTYRRLMDALFAQKTTKLSELSYFVDHHDTKKRGTDKVGSHSSSDQSFSSSSSSSSSSSFPSSSSSISSLSLLYRPSSTPPIPCYGSLCIARWKQSSVVMVTHSFLPSTSHRSSPSLHVPTGACLVHSLLLGPRSDLTVEDDSSVLMDLSGKIVSLPHSHWVSATPPSLDP